MAGDRAPLNTIFGGQYRLLEVRGAGCATCGEPDLRYGYDALGRLVSTTKLDAAGNPISAVLSELDTQGRHTRISQVDYIAGRAQPPVWRTRYAYDPQTRATEVAWPSVIPGREHTRRTEYNALGQPVRITERGFSPIDDARQPTPTGTPITRSTRYTYATINGRSVLAKIVDRGRCWI